MEFEQLKKILEAVLLTADQPMDLRKLEAIFEADENRPTRDAILKAMQSLQEDYQDRGIELKEVASGYRMQVVPDCAPWVSRMWEEKAPRYSRALLETLVLIAYRQPITRGEIEEIRGVSVSSHIIKTLSEREWVRVLGHKDVPGRPSMYGTTREFLDYFNLKSLDELPSLADIKDLDKLHPELALEQEVAEAQAGDAPTETADAADSEGVDPEAIDSEDVEDTTDTEIAEEAIDAESEESSDVEAEPETLDSVDDIELDEAENDSDGDAEADAENLPKAVVED